MNVTTRLGMNSMGTLDRLQGEKDLDSRTKYWLPKILRVLREIATDYSAAIEGFKLLDEEGKPVQATQQIMENGEPVERPIPGSYKLDREKYAKEIDAVLDEDNDLDFRPLVWESVEPYLNAAELDLISWCLTEPKFTDDAEALDDPAKK